MLLLPLPLACWLAAGLLGSVGPARATNDEDIVRSWYNMGRYLRSRPARTDDDVVNVTVGLSDAYVAYGTMESSRHISVWLTAKWNDPRLDWTQEPDMNRTRSFRTKLDPSRLWTPGLQVLGAVGKTNSLYSAADTELVISQNGDVMLVAPVHLEAMCARDADPDLSRPFLVCPFTLGSMLTSLELVDLLPISEATFTARAGPNLVQKASTIRRREIVRDCCAKPFAELEVRILFFRR